MKIRFVPADHDAAGNYRCMFPAIYLNRNGHDAEDAPHKVVPTEGPPDRIMLANHMYALEDMPSDVEVVVLHQFMQKWILKLAKPAGRTTHLMYSIDDWLVDIPRLHPAHGLYKDPEKWMGRYVRFCDGCIVSTEMLREWAVRFNPNTHLIRNRLYWPMWEDAPQQNEIDRGGRVRVGYMGAFHWRQGDLRELQGLLPQFLRKNPHVDFVVGGDPDDTHDYLKIPEDRRVGVKGFPFHENYLRLHELMPFDVGLIPLQKHAFNEAKSHLKGMEYNACGIPFIASDTESYRYYTREGGNGFIVRKPKQWLQKLDLLVNDHDLRRGMGREARRTAGQHKMEDHWQEWERAYKSVL